MSAIERHTFEVNYGVKTCPNCIEVRASRSLLIVYGLDGDAPYRLKLSRQKMVEWTEIFLKMRIMRRNVEEERLPISLRFEYELGAVIDEMSGVNASGEGLLEPLELNAAAGGRIGGVHPVNRFRREFSSKDTEGMV